MQKNAFVLLHFGDKIKYFELELYFVQMLRKYSGSNVDLIYLYLVEDTPQYFIKTMETYFTKCIGIHNIALGEYSKFNSWYSHFNTLTTCNFIHAFNLIKYNRVCILESDMIITRSIDAIFELPCPSIFFINETELFIKKPAGKEVNGGILLFKPSRYYFRKALSLFPKIIEDNSKYPNEELFLRLYSGIYALPQMYNHCHYNLHGIPSQFPAIVHFNETKFKYVDIIKDNYINKFAEKKQIVNFFKHNFYNKFKTEINEILRNYHPR